MPFTTVTIAASDGVRLAIHRLGEGPPLYAIHGGPANDHSSFGHYLDPIASNRELCLLDQRGCGDSDDAPPESYTLERLTEDIEDVRVALDQATIDILGHSYGGIIGLSYARRWPQKVANLILLAAPVRGWRGVLSDPGSWPLWARVTLEGLKKDPDWVELYLKHELRNKQTSEEIRPFLRIPKRYDQRRFKPLMRAGMPSMDVSAVIGAGVSVAGIYGAQDRRFLSTARYLSSIGIKVELIDGASHFPFVEQPDQFHRALRGLLAGERTKASSA